MGEGYRRKINNCTPANVLSMFDRLGGFSTKECRRHTKVTHDKTSSATLVPRHSKINRHLLRDIIEEYLVAKLGFDEEEVYKNLKC